MPERIGVMGGTFDPIHHGHLVAAEDARFALSLDKVVFVPAGRPWQKSEREVSPGELRYEMARLAVAGEDAFEVSRIEIERDGPTFTVDTLREFRRCSPGAELFFITGSDAILQILTWKDAEDALSLATFVAVTRPTHDLAGIEGLSEELRDRVVVVEIPALAISSTDIRKRVAESRPIRYLVPDAVALFINEHGLYRSA
jgi:nicotinate-nucleotide adenylyltransferase